MLESGLVEHADLNRLTLEDTPETLAYIPADAPRVVLASTPPQGLYGLDHYEHDCSLHLEMNVWKKVHNPHACVFICIHRHHDVNS